MDYSFTTLGFVGLATPNMELVTDTPLLSHCISYDVLVKAYTKLLGFLRNQFPSDMDLLESGIAGKLPLYLLGDLLIDLFPGLSHSLNSSL